MFGKIQEKKYDDIINLPHPTSEKHPRMDMRDRAAQFAPFAALIGHDDAIKETARLTKHQPDFDEDTIEVLDRKLQEIRSRLDKQEYAKITCFIPDERKEGGNYRTISSVIKRIDEVRHEIVLDNEEIIPIEYICDIDS